MADFCSGLDICPGYSPEKEAWAHGVTERAVNEVKDSASILLEDNADYSPEVALLLSCAANNSVETVKGYAPFQWAYGKITDLSMEQLIQARSDADPQQEFHKLMTNRMAAEATARKVRAQRALTKPSNATVRQPLRTFNMGDLVKVWRKAWPEEVRKGTRGGMTQHQASLDRTWKGNTSRSSTWTH